MAPEPLGRPPTMAALPGTVPRMMRPAPGQNYPRTGFPLEGRSGNRETPLRPAAITEGGLGLEKRRSVPLELTGGALDVGKTRSIPPESSEGASGLGKRRSIPLELTTGGV